MLTVLGTTSQVVLKLVNGPQALEDGMITLDQASAPSITFDPGDCRAHLPLPTGPQSPSRAGDSWRASLLYACPDTQGKDSSPGAPDPSRSTAHVGRGRHPAVPRMRLPSWAELHADQEPSARLALLAQLWEKRAREQGGEGRSTAHRLLTPCSDPVCRLASAPLSPSLWT